MQREVEIPYSRGAVYGLYKPGEKLVIFSHGFGTDKISGGLFSDIAKSLPAPYGYILFDYYSIDDNTWYVPPLSEMIIKLSSVLGFAKDEAKQLTVVAHSQGCSIAALAMIELNSIFLAPPTRSITEHFKDFFVSRRKGRAHLDENGDVHLTRKHDGQELHISSGWFDEMVTLDSFSRMQQLAERGKLTIIEALQDEDIKDRRRYAQLVDRGANRISIDGNHNFDPPHRHTLIDSISSLL